jgi:hypothetical protein
MERHATTSLAIVVAISVVAIEGGAGIVWCAVAERRVPTELVGMVATALGILGGVLTGPALRHITRDNGGGNNA